MITAFMCTLPARQSILPIAIASILPQIDRLILTLNNWPEGAAPDFGPKVEYRWADNSFRFGTKHVHIHEAKPGICLFVDDDIEYPPDYVEKMTAEMDRFQKSVIACGGRILKPRPITSYWGDIEKDFRVFGSIPEGQEVDYLNGATMIFRPEEYQIGPGHPMWHEGEWAEAAIGAYCRSVGLTCRVIAHSQDWLRNLMPLLNPEAETMFRKYRDEDGKMRDFVNKYF